MKKLSIVFFLALAFVFLNGQEPQEKISGAEAAAVFDAGGQLNILYSNPGQGLSLCTLENLSAGTIPEKTFLMKGRIQQPLLKRDAFGTLWALWKETGITDSHLFLAPIKGKKLLAAQKISKEFPDWNTKASFDTDAFGHIWAAWINKTAEQQSLVIKETDRESSWILSSQKRHSLYSPKILCDGSGRTWVFWIEHLNIGYVIQAGRFSDRVFDGTEYLTKPDSRPLLSLDACFDPQGRPWITWSAYDGEDYEIYASHWDGFRWEAATQVTRNKALSDVSPRIVWEGETPLILWNQAGNESRLCLRRRTGSKWTAAGNLGELPGFNRNPLIVKNRNSLAAVWENITDLGTEIKFQNIGRMTWEAGKHRSHGRRAVSAHGPAQKSAATARSLIKNRYSAIGDSVTYGVLGRRWFPELGYVPRLEHLVQAFVDSARIINRGIPGEETWEGLARLDALLQADRSSYVLLMEGTNDMFAEIAPEIAAFNMEEMVKKSFQHGVYPLLATIIPRSDASWEADIQKATRIFNDLVRGIPVKYAIPLVDQFEVFVSHPNGYLPLFGDGAHPNETGYHGHGRSLA